jgi:hypothetical protein
MQKVASQSPFLEQTQRRKTKVTGIVKGKFSDKQIVGLLLQLESAII